MSKLFVSNLPAVTIVLNAASTKALHATADVGRNQVVKNLTGAGGPRTGHRYRVPKTNRYYTASAPGQFPAHDRFGHLRGSYRVKEISPSEIQVGSDSEYALPLEKKPESKGGRPHLKRSLDQAKPAMLAKLAQRWF